MYMLHAHKALTNHIHTQMVLMCNHIHVTYIHLHCIGTTPCNGTSASLPAAQCAAWQDLYASTGGGSGPTHTWNACGNTSGAATDPCSCAKHVTCTIANVAPSGSPSVGTTNYISGLQLNNLGLTGTLPELMSAFRNLTKFDVNCNALTGVFPKLGFDWANLAGTGSCNIGGPTTRRCLPGKTANVGGNKWTCPFPAKLPVSCLASCTS